MNESIVKKLKNNNAIIFEIKCFAYMIYFVWEKKLVIQLKKGRNI